LSTTDKDWQNASSLVATVKLYPAFARAFSGMNIRPHDHQSNGKNLSPLFGFFAIDELCNGFKPPQPKLKRFMTHPG